MIEFLAQAQAPDITAIAIQGTVGGIVVIMLKWFMGKNDQALRAVVESNNRIAASNDRMGRAHLMLVLALDGVNEAAKQRAKTAMTEVDDALKEHDQRDKENRQ